MDLKSNSGKLSLKQIILFCLGIILICLVIIGGLLLFKRSQVNLPKERQPILTPSPTPIKGLDWNADLTSNKLCNETLRSLLSSEKTYIIPGITPSSYFTISAEGENNSKIYFSEMRFEQYVIQFYHDHENSQLIKCQLYAMNKPASFLKKLNKTVKENQGTKYDVAVTYSEQAKGIWISLTPKKEQ